MDEQISSLSTNWALLSKNVPCQTDHYTCEVIQYLYIVNHLKWVFVYALDNMKLQILPQFYLFLLFKYLSNLYTQYTISKYT